MNLCSQLVQVLVLFHLALTGDWTCRTGLHVSPWIVQLAISAINIAEIGSAAKYC